MATGDGLLQKQRNEEIGACAGRIHVALHSFADEHKFTYVERMQALLAVFQNLASMMRENPNAT